MTLLFIRILFIVGAVLIGYQTGGPANGWIKMLAGGFAGLLIILFEIGMRRISVRGLSSAVFGLLLGLVMSG